MAAPVRAGFLSGSQYARNTINAAQSLLASDEPPTGDFILREDGTELLREDGTEFVRE